MKKTGGTTSEPDALQRYRDKRDFAITPEPDAGTPAPGTEIARFVIQKHWARRLHYDFRLEIAGTMKSWAVPKGPSLDPAVKRMAVHVEDHPIAYNDFEGTIPPGQYGAGKVIIWDRGHWRSNEDPVQAYESGKLKFELHGSKLRGRWALVRMGGRKKPVSATRGGARNGGAPGGPATEAAAGAASSADSRQQDTWLLIKEKDAHARSEVDFDITKALPDSVAAQPKPRNAVRKSPAVPCPAMPRTLSPQLATRVSAAPGSGDWVYELKYDGYRILARVDAGHAVLHTRQGHDWTDRLRALAEAMESQRLPGGWYDGEIVVLNDAGHPSFQALQNAFDGAGTQDVVYFLFDLPWLEHEDLRRRPLSERRRRLEEIMEHSDHPALRLSAVFEVPAQDMLRSACKLGLEGIIGKKRSSSYVSGRSGHWVKLKCGERQEFVVGGYTEPKGARLGFGALLLGYYDDQGRLQYAGNVGSGFNDATLETLQARLHKLRQGDPPFANPPRQRQVHWVKPELSAEISFSQWTASGRIRHATFQGLREDKPTHLMKKERSRTITNPERLVDTESGTRKGDIVAYYERIAPLIMPHLKDRPVSWLRAPEGIKGEMFFQKHVEAARLDGILQLDPDLDPGHDPLVVIQNAAGLGVAAQLNVIEFHTWNAVRSRIDRPDRLSFDLDPGAGVKWPAMQEAAILLRNFLHELELPAFLKTSGGKGLHVIVPIVRRYDWETAKGLSRAVVQHMAEVLPQRFSAKSGPRNRVGKIFIDYLRNGFGATTVAAWSLRARPGMGISVPISWEEVETIEGGDHWKLANIDERLEIGNEPWMEYAGAATGLGPAMKALGYRG